MAAAHQGEQRKLERWCLKMCRFLFVSPSLDLMKIKIASFTLCATFNDICMLTS